MSKDREPDATVIMLIRHAERPDGDGPPYGVDENGARCDESLTPAGWERAAGLVRLFAPDDGEPTGGLVRPGALVASTPSKKGGSLRSLQTLTPLADVLGRTVDTGFARSDVKALAKSLRAATRPVLVSWQREYLPEIVAAIGDEDVDVPERWPEDRYDIVWVLTRTGSKQWSLSQVPQRLLAGDRPTAL